MRAVMLVGSAGSSIRSRSSGNNAVRSSNRGRRLASSGDLPLTDRISSTAGFFSLRPAGRLMATTWSPLRSPYCRDSFTGTYESLLLAR